MSKLDKRLQKNPPAEVLGDPGAIVNSKDDLHSLPKVLETAQALEGFGIHRSSVGIVLGTGLGSLTESLTQRVTVDFGDCPHFPRATSIGHNGNVVGGTLHGKSVIAMEGRLHAYEGYSLKEITYPIRVLKALGVQTLILSNAAGGLNPSYALGDLMVIEDHINLMGDSPLAGRNDDRLGPRFPDMAEPYSRKLIGDAEEAAGRLGIRLHQGVYVGVKGPQLETRAEYRFLRQIGADAVGMSTVPEVIVAIHAGLRTLAVSCITDMCLPDQLEPINIEKILETAKKAEPVLTQLVSEVVRQI